MSMTMPVLKQWQLALLLSTLLPAVSACGGSRITSTDNRDPTPTPSGPTEITIDPATKLQTLEGFGASIAWYQNLFTAHPNREALGTILFRDLGLDILRMRNQYRAPGDMPDPLGIEVYRAATTSLGHPPRVLLTSWSPPAVLKASGKTNCSASDTNLTCTLRQNADGTFPYEEFANYWVESLRAYSAGGLEPYYISIQNEPDFRPTGWEGCLFNETERDGLPGYDQALEAVSKQLVDNGIATRILAADTAHLQNGAVLRYADAMDTSLIYGLAHHLYDGASWKSPDAFYSSMSDLATNQPELPKFQTEFSPTLDGKAVEAGFDVARLIHNSMNYEGASAYLHWELIWPNSGLVAVDGSPDATQWKTPEGYRILEPYYSLRHFARYTDPGDKVVANSASTTKILATAYLAPDETRLTVVLLNSTEKSERFKLDISGFSYTSSLIVTTTTDAQWQNLPALAPDAALDFELAAHGMMTLVLTQTELPTD